jgi:hypothetical protein
MPSSMFPLTVNFAGNHGKRVFESPDELAIWIEKEMKGYEDFAKAQVPHNIEPYRGLREVFSQLSSAQSHAQQLQALPIEDSRAFVQHASQATQHLQFVYVQRGLPPANSYEIQALRPLLLDEPRAAVAALFAVSKPVDIFTIQQLDSSAALGLGLAARLRFKLDGDVETVAFNKAADSALAAINLRADETQLRVTEQIRLADEAQGRVSSAWDTHNEDYAKLSGSLKQKVEEKIEAADKEINDFKLAHHAEIALKEPVMFWQDKAKTHRGRANLFAVLGLVAAVCTGISAVLFIPELLGPATASAPTELARETAAIAQGSGRGVPSYYGIALAVIFSTLTLWLLRILVRGYFSQTHLATDAEERVAMVKTYLALMESGKAPSDTLTPVLLALFRPASDGLVKDDSMPAGFAELLSKPR